jgi:hypothetical protein
MFRRRLAELVFEQRTSGWSASVVAQPDLGARTKESDSQFDGSYDAITLANGSRETGAKPTSTISQRCRPHPQRDIS